MPGHSRSAQIEHGKKAVDARRGQLFTKPTRAIPVAARDAGAIVVDGVELQRDGRFLV
jgi:transcriptional/translational regulatory protein YebC/TACO1